MTPGDGESRAPIGPRAMLVVVALMMLAASCRPAAQEPSAGGSTPAATDDAMPSQEPDALVDPGDLTDVLPPDAIPSIDRPRFVAPDEVGWMGIRGPTRSRS